MNSLIPPDSRVHTANRPEFTDEQNVLLSDTSALIAHAVRENHMDPRQAMEVFVLVLSSMARACEAVKTLTGEQPSQRN